MDRTLAVTRLLAEHDRATFDAILDTAAAIAENEFAPHAAKADIHEPEFDGQGVRIIPEVKAALTSFVESGLMGATFDHEVGGRQSGEWK